MDETKVYVDWPQKAASRGKMERNFWLWWGLQRACLMRQVVLFPFMGGKQVPEKESDFFLRFQSIHFHLLS